MQQDQAIAIVRLKAGIRLRLRFTRVLRNFSVSAKATISLNFLRISARLIPRTARVEIDDLAAVNSRMKADADLDQARDSVTLGDPSGGRFINTAQYLQEHAPAAAVATRADTDTTPSAGSSSKT
jgi:hypothetical protein